MSSPPSPDGTEHSGGEMTVEPVPVRFWWLKRILLVGGIVLVAMGALRIWWGWEAHRRLQAEIDKYIAAGEPIYPEDFDSKWVPDDQNAVKFLLDAAAEAIGVPDEAPRNLDSRALLAILPTDIAVPDAMTQQRFERGRCGRSGALGCAAQRGLRWTRFAGSTKCVLPRRSRAADVAELADALASGASGGNPVEVRVLSSAWERGRWSGRFWPPFYVHVDGICLAVTRCSRGVCRV